PHLSGIILVVPFVLTAIWIECDNGSHKQVVVFIFGTKMEIPRPSVSSSDVNLIEFFIKSDGIPGRTPPTVFPPLTRPSLCRHRHCIVLEALGRVSRNRKESPCK